MIESCRCTVCIHWLIQGRFITYRIRRMREGNILILSTPGGGTRARSSWGGTPGTPLSDLDGGTPMGGTMGTPHQTWTWGTPIGGVPSQTWMGGGTPLRLTDGVLDTPRSVCLLRSRRRTFLWLFILWQVKISEKWNLSQKSHITQTEKGRDRKTVNFPWIFCNTRPFVRDE